MKYSVYVRTPQETTMIINTDDLYKASKAYYGIVVSSSGPRISIDGNEMRILEADEYTMKVLRGKTKRGAVVRNDILRERSV